MSNHTQGPWKLIKNEDTEQYTVTTRDGEPGFHRCISTVEFGFSEPAESEQHANARLIAASTEMYDALKFIINQMMIPENASHTLESYRHGIGFDMAKKALSKADGDD